MELPNKGCLIAGTPCSCGVAAGFVKIGRQWDGVRMKYQTYKQSLTLDLKIVFWCGENSFSR